MLISLALQVLYDVVLLAVCAHAFFRGGRDEKLGALLVLAGSAATAIVTAPRGFSWGSEHSEVMLIDFVLFLGLGGLATFSKRFWPLWATAFQLIDITTHMLMLVEPSRALRAYVILQGFWAYPILLVVAIGTGRHQRRTAATKLRSSDPHSIDSLLD